MFRFHVFGPEGECLGIVSGDHQDDALNRAKSKFARSDVFVAEIRYRGASGESYECIESFTLVCADGTQMSISVPCQLMAITPNEVRALRGRKAYRVGEIGDDPMCDGVPIPLN